MKHDQIQKSKVIRDRSRLSHGRNHDVLIDFAMAKKKAKKRYMDEIEPQLRRFLRHFVAEHFPVDYSTVNKLYLEERLAQNEMAWDFQDLREVISEGIYRTYGKILWEEIKLNSWFRPGLIGLDELTECCTTAFILNQTAMVSP